MEKAKQEKVKSSNSELEPEDPRWNEFNPKTRFEAVVRFSPKVSSDTVKPAFTPPPKPLINVSVSKQKDTMTFKPMLAPSIEPKQRIYKTMDEALAACRYEPPPKCPKCGCSHGPEWVCVIRKTEKPQQPVVSVSKFKMTPEALRLIGAK